MVRLVGFAAGLFFVVVLLVSALLPREAPTPDMAKQLHKYPHEISWHQDGPFGTFDRAQLQRGFQVYKEVCSACHGIKRVAFRNLQDIGFSEAEVKAIAKGYEVDTLDPATGEPAKRPAIPSDRFPPPFPNEIAARAANNNAYPPDLSLIVKARHDGLDYLHSLTTGYGKEPPKGWAVPEGLYYNPYFHSVNIAMPPPLVADDQVTYADGTKATIDQMSRDVSAFLHWAAEPELERRKQAGVITIVFLSILSLLAFLTYRRVWAGTAH
ncbi:cytochrome c1 [Sandaracinobacteroides saxicola]|uniref:Cytochrome c1 n=1 Tax=Sandaracinobacteroides saxicola TaxID=2759707 RepID=A0A7G5IKG8_9SPHN|nr:cytochrome c1 [Sandaracinobacteroides saxicola]QMW23860.1 cytochrome c1 [Sandaracinobacteroides saxicola]